MALPNADITTNDTPAHDTPAHDTPAPFLGDDAVAPSSEVKKQQVFELQGSLEESIAHWLWAAGVEQIAWGKNIPFEKNLSPETLSLFPFLGDLSAVAALISADLGMDSPLTFFVSVDDRLAAVHNFTSASIHIVEGETLKEAAKNLVVSYGWNFSEKISWPSSVDDYLFDVSFPIVTRKDDIASGLKMVLDGFPVIAKLDIATRTVHFTEDSK